MCFMKILTIVGARPQFIKAAAFSRALASYPKMTEVIVHTGQHFDAKMSDVFFEEMEIPRPKYNLGVHSMGFEEMTAQMTVGIEEILDKEKPDLVLVYGDTNSTLAGANAARNKKIRIAHVEAGMRSYNLKMREETNRIATDEISDFLFCSTSGAVENLEKENLNTAEKSICNVGDIMLDGALFYANKIKGKPSPTLQIPFDNFILCTIHRAENTDHPERLKEIVLGINEIHKTTPVILPIHPRTAALIDKLSVRLNAHIIEPVGYFDMIRLIQGCSLVMTDSGGLQKEAFFFKRNCVTMRDQTEWVQLVEGGFNILAKATASDIVEKVNLMSKRSNDFEVNLYGDGNAAHKIIAEIKSNFALS